MNKYRFFYHYNKQTKKLSVHFKGVCHPVKNVVCLPYCQSKWNKRQPYLVMQGYAQGVEIVDEVANIY
jgi:hypothetical protein